MDLRDIRKFLYRSTREPWECVQAALGLWAVPWAPVFAAVLVAYQSEWSFPATAAAVFLLGWPASFYVWLKGGGDVQGR